MTAKIINLQDNFIKGAVRGFDNFVVMVDAMGKQQMIYKHAISTITPAQTVKTLPEDS